MTASDKIAGGVPRAVRESAGAARKTPLFPQRPPADVSAELLAFEADLLRDFAAACRGRADVGAQRRNAQHTPPGADEPTHRVARRSRVKDMYVVRDSRDRQLVARARRVGVAGGRHHRRN